MSDLTALSIVVRGSDHVETSLGEQVVMMSLSRGKYYALDETGRRIWDLVQEPTAIRAIVETLTGEYDVEPARCEAEVLAFLHDMLGNGLVRWVGEVPA